MKYETQIIKYRGKFIPVVKTNLGFQGIERKRTSWFKKKILFYNMADTRVYRKALFLQNLH